MIQTKQLKSRPAWFSLERLNQELLLGAFLILVTLAFTLVRPDFLSSANFLKILIDGSFVMVAAVGITLVIVSGGIDISIGSMLAVCAVVGGLLAQTGIPVPLAWLGIILTGALFGLVNGALVTWAGIPSIIVTLGMLSILRGSAILVSGGSWIRNLPENFYIGQQSFLGVPVPIWVMVLVVGIASIWLNYAPLGRQFYAVGGNREAARLGGIPVKRIQLLSFTLNGFLVGLATLIFATRFSAIQVNSGVGFELRVITAAVVGGVSIMGGSGTVAGAILGVLLLEVIGSGMVFLRVSAYWFQAVQGLLILLAVVFDILRKRRLGEM
jgi:ribose/xylose/arabinose/galactoside ABC-type transport system permease subunit